MEAVKTVTVIPARKKISEGDSMTGTQKKRVAAYARVSTDFGEQISSFEAQREYYLRHIRSKPDWKLVEIYTDEGISATNTKKRDGFNRMVRDALEGRIDLIITKSISRFARNTVDTLTTVRKLKEKGVEVYFEKENIYTMDSKGELLITIMSSLAQEESRSISENVTWGHRKRFADGKVSLPYGQFLGYEKGEDGLPRIVEEEAETVREIYRLFLEGKTPYGIARNLTKDGIRTPSGKEKWSVSTVNSILQNEKYKGDALLQKGYTVDFLTKKRKINEGEVPQYYVENSHPAIIEPDTFDMVQLEIERRKKAKGYKTGKGCFSGKIVCGECGNFYGRKIWHSNSKYRRVVWQCNHKYSNDKKCKTTHLNEEDIKKSFVQVFNTLVDDRERIVDGCIELIDSITDSTEEKSDLETMTVELEILQSAMEKLIHDNARLPMDQDEYIRKYGHMADNLGVIEERIEELKESIESKRVRRSLIGDFMDIIRNQEELLDSFDKDIWISTVDHIKVESDRRLVFVFKDGREVSYKLSTGSCF
jgi:DNA invertase Pin-like site-specific DNA recombinase